jgi:hypothetical protein
MKLLPFIVPARRARFPDMTTLILNPAMSLMPGLPPRPAALLDKHFLRKHGAHAYYGQK